MALANKLRIVETARDKRALRELNQRVKQLSGIEWPPKDSAAATIILTRAGWSQSRIEQFCAMFFGTYDVAEVGELPHGYLSSGKDDFPTFTASLITGLEKRHREHSGETQLPRLTANEERARFCFDQWQEGQTYKEINVALKQRPEWEAFADNLAVRSAIQSWAKRIGAEPRKGQPGRRSKT